MRREDLAALNQLADGQPVTHLTRRIVLSAIANVLKGRPAPPAVSPPPGQPRPRPYVWLPLDVSEYHLWCRACNRVNRTQQDLAYAAIRAELSASVPA